MARDPTLVFIPGAWHSPACYDPLIEGLDSKYALKSRKVMLPSTTGDKNATFKDDLDSARTVVTSCLDQDEDVIVIAHSYGGIVGGSVIKGLARPKNHSATGSCVIGLVLIASGFSITGLSFMDPFFGIPPPAWKKNTTTGFAELVKDPVELFYHDVEPKEATYWVSQLRPQSLKALFEGGEHVYSGWKHVPIVYIGTTEDRGIPLWAQRMQVGIARGQGAEVIHYELCASHSPFLSRPDDVAEILSKAADGFKQTQEDPSEAVIRKELSLVKLWPRRWLRFGLFAGIGEMIGRVMIFTERSRLSWGRAASGRPRE